MTRLLPILLLAACGAEPGPDACGASSGLVVATTDYTVGALATVDADGVLVDRVASVGGDPIVRSAGGFVWQLGRSSSDTLRRYTPGAYCRPDWEVALPQGSNGHDVEVVGEEVWVAAYDRAEIELRSVADGSRLGAIDLGALADDDGIPELEDLLALPNGDVLVAAQRFVRSEEGWRSTEGRVARLDTSGVVQESWPTGPSPRLANNPVDPMRPFVLTGVFGVPDGGVQQLDLDAPTLDSSFLLSESDLARDLSRLVVVDGYAVVLGVPFDQFPEQSVDGAVGEGSVVCLKLATGALSEGPRELSWLVDLAEGEGLAWIGARRVVAESPVAGLFSVDPIPCETVGPRLASALDPYSLTRVDTL